jgi:hypothetical protein
VLADVPKRLNAAFVCPWSHVQQLIVDDLTLELNRSVEETFLGSDEFVFFGLATDGLLLESHVIFGRKDRHDVAT